MPLLNALIYKIRNKEIKKSKDAINHLRNAGVPEGRAGNILKMLINKYLGDVIMAEEKTAGEVIDTSTDELLKALDELGDGLPERVFGIDAHKAGHVYEHEEDISKLVLYTVRVLAGKRLAELSEFLVELVHDVLDVFPFKALARGP